MPWQIFLLLSTAAISLDSVLQRKLMLKKTNDPIASAIAFQLYLGLSLLIFSFFLGWGNLVLKTNWLLILAVAIIWTFSTIFGFKANKHIGASDLTIVTASGAIFTVIGSILVLQENFHLSQAIGLVLILLAVYLVNRAVEKSAHLDSRGMVYGLITAFLGGMAVIFDVYILKTANMMSYITLMAFMPALIMGMLYPKKVIEAGKLMLSSQWWMFLLFGANYALYETLYYLAIKSGAGLSQTSTIESASVVLTAILSYFWLKERENLPQKILALGLAAAGVYLIA